MIKKQPQFNQRASLLILCVFCFSLLTLNSYAQFSKKQEVTFKIGMAGYTFKDISVDNTIEMMKHIGNMDARMGICMDIGHTTRDRQDPLPGVAESIGYFNACIQCTK